MLLNEAGTDTLLFLSFVLKQTKCFLGAQKIRKLLSSLWKSHLKRNLTKVQGKNKQASVDQQSRSGGRGARCQPSVANARRSLDSGFPCDTPPPNIVKI